MDVVFVSLTDTDTILETLAQPLKVDGAGKILIDVREDLEWQAGQLPEQK